MKDPRQFQILTHLAPQFEEICRRPEFNIDIVRMFSIGHSTIYEYDHAGLNKNTLIGTALENIQSAAIECYRMALLNMGSGHHSAADNLHTRQCNCPLKVGMCKCP